MLKIKSFTLIELLIVIVIIGILAGVIMISTSSVINKAHDATRKQDLGVIARGLRAYGSVNGAYPVMSCKVGESGCLENLIPDYLSALPVDPISGNYGYSSTGSEFMLLAKGSSNPISYTDSNGFNRSIVATSSYYGFSRKIRNVLFDVDDFSNGALWGYVANFTKGWRGTIDIGTKYGFEIGAYDIYMRVRTDGIGTHPTSFSTVGIWNWTDYKTHKTFSVYGLTSSYKIKYLGRFSVPDDKRYYTWFSSSSVTTNYYIDYVEFRPVD